MKKIIIPLLIMALFACKSDEKKGEAKAEIGKNALFFYELRNIDTTYALVSVDSTYEFNADSTYKLTIDSTYEIASIDTGVRVILSNYGARIVSVITPDRNGNFADIALGYNTHDEYLHDKIYSGPIVGRYANRIKDARFTLDSVEYELNKNEGENTLHGGFKGLDKKVWQASQEGNSVVMTYLSPHMEEGYPGNLDITVTYTLTDDDALIIEYLATTDSATVLNLTNHTLWNLKGEGDTTILDHYFQINADYFTPIGAGWMPTGEIAHVEGTALDFRQGKQIGRDIESGDPHVEAALGYDHNWVLNKTFENELSWAATLWEENTGRALDIWTTEPGFQFYSGNFLDTAATNTTVTGKSGKPYLYRSALIFEAQHFPDAPNNPNFPSTVLRPGTDVESGMPNEYTQTTIIKFLVLEPLIEN